MRQGDLVLGEIYAGPQSWYRGPYLLLDKRLYTSRNDKIEPVREYLDNRLRRRSSFDTRYEGYLFLEVLRPIGEGKPDWLLEDKIKLLRDLDLDDLPRDDKDNYAHDSLGIEIDGIRYGFRTMKGQKIAAPVEEVMARAEADRKHAQEQQERKEREQEAKRRLDYASGVFVRGVLANAGAEVGDMDHHGSFDIVLSVDGVKHRRRIFSTEMTL